MPRSVKPPVVVEEEQEASLCSAFEDVDRFDHLQASVVEGQTDLDDQKDQTQPEQPTMPLNRSDIVQALIMAAQE